MIQRQGEGGRVKYVLIGLAPYIFHNDESKSFENCWRLHQYFIAFNDLHNFWMPIEQYKTLFNENFLLWRFSIEPFEINNVSFEKMPLRVVNGYHVLSMRKEAERWAEKEYPDTRAENIKILDDYLTLCEKNNARPIMFLPITCEGHMKYFSKKKLDEFHYLIDEALKKHSSAVFADGWKFQGFTDSDFYDSTHMNINGAAKFSSMLNDFIEKLEVK